MCEELLSYVTNLLKSINSQTMIYKNHFSPEKLNYFYCHYCIGITSFSEITADLQRFIRIDFNLLLSRKAVNQFFLRYSQHGKYRIYIFLIIFLQY